MTNSDEGSSRLASLFTPARGVTMLSPVLPCGLKQDPGMAGAYLPGRRVQGGLNTVGRGKPTRHSQGRTDVRLRQACAALVDGPMCQEDGYLQSRWRCLQAPEHESCPLFQASISPLLGVCTPLPYTGTEARRPRSLQRRQQVLLAGKLRGPGAPISLCSGNDKA